MDISDLSIVSGDATGLRGGGIYGNSANLVLENCKLRDSTAAFGGGICTLHTSADITDCVFNGNTATSNGGAMYNCDDTCINITDCTLGNNTAGTGGGISNADLDAGDISGCIFDSNTADDYSGGGIYDLFSSTDVADCTFCGNHAENSGAGLYNYGNSMNISGCTFSGDIAESMDGGIVNNNVSANILNSTFSGNTAQYGGAVLNVGVSADIGIMNCTFSENIASDDCGSGLYTYYYGGDMIACNVVNSIFWDGGSSEVSTDVSCSVKPAIGYCVVSGDVSDAACTVSGDIFTEDPKLGVLADNGGDTMTCAIISSDSSAVNAGTADGAPGEDQRGISRPRGGGYDIGAYESDFESNNSGGSSSSGCSIGYIGPAALLLLAPLWFLLGKKAK